MIDFSRISDLETHPPVGKDKIDAVENKLKITLPNAYRQILNQTNGFFTESGVLIYGTDDIIERNITLEVNDYAEGYVAIGDDSGDIVFLMRQNFDAKEILAVDCGDMNVNNAKQISSDLIKWVAEGCIIELQQSPLPSYTDLYDVILISNPGGMKELLKLKSTLEFDMPTVELLKGSKELPFRLMSNVPYGKTIRCIEKLGDLGRVLQLVRSGANW